MKENVPFFGSGTQAVYDYHILLRSWLAVSTYAGKWPIRIPEDLEELIESVYDKRECPAELSIEIKKKWEDSKRELEASISLENNEAEDRCIKWPGYKQEIWRICADPREEDNPEFHKAHQALTRLTGVSVSVICLFDNKAGLYLDSSKIRALNLNMCPDKDLVKDLLVHSVVISHTGLVEKIIEADIKVPQAWREEVLLRHQYVLLMDSKNQ
jgi:hypothetical protein